MRAPTPETTSIMKIESGSTRMLRPTWKLPAASHVHALESCERSPVSRPSIEKKATAAAMNETKTEAVARRPAPRRVQRVPPSVIATVAPSGANRQTHEAMITSFSAADAGLASDARRRSFGQTGRVAWRSSAQGRELVDVQHELPPVHGHDQAEADDDLGGGDGHHGEREHLPVEVPMVPREGDEGQVGPVQHDLEREQDDQRASA